MKNLYYLVSLCLVAISSCVNVNQDPSKGAKQLYEKLRELDSEDDLKEANSIMLVFWNAYDEKQRDEFLLSFRDRLMDGDYVVGIITQNNFDEYPMFETYLKNMHRVAFEKAKAELAEITDTSDKSTYSSSAASKGLIFGILLTRYYNSKAKRECDNMIEGIEYDLNSQGLMYKIEFASALRAYMQESGDDGGKAYLFLRERLKDPAHDDFLKLLVESTIIYD